MRAEVTRKIFPDFVTQILDLMIIQEIEVTAGQAVGKVGNSGNTSEPHLHVHLQDGPPTDLMVEGIPLYFHDYKVGGQVVERGMPTGGVNETGWAGQVVEHTGPPKP